MYGIYRCTLHFKSVLLKHSPCESLHGTQDFGLKSKQATHSTPAPISHYNIHLHIAALWGAVYTEQLNCWLHELDDTGMVCMRSALCHHRYTPCCSSDVVCGCCDCLMQVYQLRLDTAAVEPPVEPTD
jgi:hypothetical protein